MHGRIGGLRDGPAFVDQTAAEVGFVEVIIIFLIEAPQFAERLAAEHAISAHRVREERRERIGAVFERSVQMVRSAEAVGGGEAELVIDSSKVDHGPAGAGDVGLSEHA